MFTPHIHIDAPSNPVIKCFLGCHGSPWFLRPSWKERRWCKWCIDKSTMTYPHCCYRLLVLNSSLPLTGWARQSWTPRWAWSCWLSGEWCPTRRRTQSNVLFLHHFLHIYVSAVAYFLILLSISCSSPPAGSPWIPRNCWTPRHQGTQSKSGRGRTTKNNNSELLNHLYELCFSWHHAVGWLCLQGFSGLDGAKGDAGPSGPKVRQHVSHQSRSLIIDCCLR